MNSLRYKTSWMIAAVLLLQASAAHAWLHKVDPGEVPKLGPDDGLIVMAVDSSQPLRSVRLNEDSKTLGAAVMNHVAAGQNYAMYVAPAGKYAWHRVNTLFNFYVKLRDDPEFRFDVAPGHITYPGDLVVRPQSFWHIAFSMMNRSLAAIDWLQSTHPALYSRYDFVYSGYYPDPFPAFYRSERKRHPDARPPEKVKLKPPPAPHKLAIPAESLFRSPRIDAVDINPRGDLLALHVHEKKDDWQIRVIDLVAGTSRTVAKSVLPFRDIEWSGSAVLLFASGSGDSTSLVRAVRWSGGGQGNRTLSVLKLPDGGSVLDALPDEPDAILFASGGLDGGLRVHRMDISSQEAIDHTDLSFRARLNKGVSNDVWWLADAQGNLRLAVVRRDESNVVMYARDGRFSPIMTLEDLEDFNPVGVSADAKVIYAISDQNRAQRDLVAWDVDAGKVVRTLFSRPGVDVHTVLFGQHRQPIGVAYYAGGRLVNAYFADDRKRLAASIAAAFPGRNISIADRSRDGKHLVLWVDASDQPPSLYHLDTENHRAELLMQDMPWLDGKRFSATRVVRFQGSGGMPLEAFLTLPAGSGKHPLVVFPHGGPVGVADTLQFDPEVQFLASLGYAVLQVNYRGSEGYGRAFREAGKQGYGTLIEDDIDAAIRTVVAAQAIDATRMCAVGASYGGYSAMVMAIRWPKRFRCVVSISGVADRILFFTASDGGRSVSGRKQLEHAIGNPNTDEAAMRATSPLYHYKDLTVPVMLVHGLEDQRVDYEHTRRMLRMLDIAGRTPVGLEFADEGHGMSRPEDWQKMWNGIAGFLQKYLDNPD